MKVPQGGLSQDTGEPWPWSEHGSEDFLLFRKDETKIVLSSGSD